MKRILILTALTLVAFVGLQAQSLEQVLEKHYKASGLDKIADIETFYVKAKMSMMGMDMPMTMQVKQPDKFKIEMNVMGQTVLQAYDGEAGWVKNPMNGGGITDLKGAELQQAMSQTDFEGELYHYAEKGHSAELIGKVNLDGAEAYRIKLTNADGTVKDYYIDGQSYLLSKVKAKVESMGQTMNVETTISDYKQIDGIQFGCKMDINTPMGTQSMVMEEIKLNEAIDDAVFARPAE